ncbi:MAG TPA: tetratricopeptide repeat protein [Longimicrobium sp.]|jgi:tetratricopeptide (TPR) repeat protein
MIRHSLLIALLTAGSAAFTPSLGAQAAAARPADNLTIADSVQRAATASFFRGDRAGVRAARMLGERGLAAHPNDALLLHQTGYAFYREALLLTSATTAQSRSPEDAKTLRDLLTRAEQTLNKSAALRRLPETHALLAAVYGQQAGAARGVGAMRPGMRAGTEIERAMDIDRDNPRVWLLRGTNALYTPAMWGGGQDKALEALQRSVQLFANDAQRGPLPTWGRAEAYAWLGIVHSRKREYAQARVAYNEALRLEPSYGWVRDLLLPRLPQAAR